MSAIAAGLEISKWAVAVNAALALTKIGTGTLGNSQALVADGIESTVDVFSSAIVWAGLRFSLKPADERHPYGNGKAEPIAGMLVCL